MTLTVDITPDIEQAIHETALRHGQTPEEAVTAALKSVFVDRVSATATTLDDDRHQAFLEAHFSAAAKATRSVWDTLEEDAAWESLQALPMISHP
jgi:hypothetical protein